MDVMVSIKPKAHKKDNVAAKAKVADLNLSGGGKVGADKVRHVTLLQQDVIIVFMNACTARGDWSHMLLPPMV